MARVFETQTVVVDGNGSPLVNQNLDKDFQVLEVAIITNIVRAKGVREITLGIVYDDAVTQQASLSLEQILVGQNITPVTDVAISDVQTIIHTEFVDIEIRNDDEFLCVILTISEVGAQTNQYSTLVNQLDPSDPITTGAAVGDTGTLLESHLVNVGSLQHTSQETRGQGTLNSVLITVSQA